MNLSWRLGRIGPMLVTLDYTWLPVGGLLLWILALVRLPPFLNGQSSQTVWFLAAGMGVLFSAGLVGSEAVRTVLAGIFSRRWPRSVHLCPFGAAVAYPLETLSPGRAMAVALAGPVVLALLGGVYALGADWVTPANGYYGVLRTLAQAHLGVAILNLFPGIPLAGGWGLVGALRWFDFDNERAVRLADRLGLAAVLGLLLAGGVIIIGGGPWPWALGLLALAWSLREGASVVEGRLLASEILDHMTAGEVMQPAPAVIHPEHTLDHVFRGQSYGTARVLPVQDAKGAFQGILPLSLSDRLLQGTWGQTTVGAVMLPAEQFQPVELDTPLPTVLTILGREAAVPVAAGIGEDDLAAQLSFVPVVARGRVRGLVGWDQIAEYERLAAEAGVQEASALEGRTNPVWRRFAWIGLALALIIGVPLLSLVGTRIIGPMPTRGAAPTALPVGSIVLADVSPADGAVVARGLVTIHATVQGDAPIQEITLSYDGQALDTTLDATGSLQATASAQVSATMLGPHTLAAEVREEGGFVRQSTWNITVVDQRVDGGSTQPAAPAGGAGQ